MTAVAVYPLVPTRSFDAALTYTVPDGMDLDVGSIVEIPLGPAKRVGVVAEVDVAAPDGVTLKPVRRVLGLPSIPSTLVRLAEWVADQYGCARTRALALVVSPRVAAHARAADVPHRARVQAVRRVMQLAPGATIQREQLPTGSTARLADVATRITESWEPVAAVLERLGTTRPSLQRLVDAGVVEIAEHHLDELTPVNTTVTDHVEEPGDVVAPVILKLTAEQQAAVSVCAGTEAGAGSLLVGITGSGKTEVYMELIDAELADGRGAIVLVPEIALTPQTARRFQQRFPGQVEVLHSGMTRSQRADAWERIVQGTRRVVVGPRSAVFAPVHELGLIMIDEEHDSSYKQDSEPRYDARRVAWRRAQLDGARVVYGSATPRPESWHGISRHAVMQHRASGGRLAPVQLVDLRASGDDYPFTEELTAAIDATLRRGRKAIVLHNRRGYANALHCRECSHTFRCVACDVSLVVHGSRAAAQQLACHHCGYRAPMPTSCPSCRATDIARMGAGTQRLERDLEERFGVDVFRLDADAVRGGGDVGSILEQFASAGPSILTGTQMVAKGHDFPDVELAAVVDADTALAIPDFRAEERAFSLVAQLAGRAGRAANTAEHARVIVQSWDIESEFLQFAQQHDVGGFLEREIERRRVHSYPPFSRLVRVLITARDDRDAMAWAQAVAEGMRTLACGPVLGPAPLLRLSRRERAQVITKVDPRHVTAVASSVRRFIATTERDRQRRDVRVLLDVDPQALI